MIKTILLDCDGPVIKREMYFSRRLISEHARINLEKVQSFFEGAFQSCLTGKADLKIELSKVINEWGYRGTVEDLMDYWFRNETEVDRRMLDWVALARNSGVKCYVVTDNEKYRVNYLLQVVGLRNHFDGCLASCDLGCKKSEAGFWESVNRKLGNPDSLSVLVIDDDSKNLESAKPLGFNTELFTDFETFKNKIITHGF